MPDSRLPDSEGEWSVREDPADDFIAWASTNPPVDYQVAFDYMARDAALTASPYSISETIFIKPRKKPLPPILILEPVHPPTSWDEPYRWYQRIFQGDPGYRLTGKPPRWHRIKE